MLEVWSPFANQSHNQGVSMYTGFVNRHAEREIASPFYQHPYGGIARDVWCTREGFARFFEVSLEEVDSLECNMKVFDVMEDQWTECLGYKIQDRRHRRWDGRRWIYNKDAPVAFKITIIERSHSRCGLLLRIAPYLWSHNQPSFTN